MPLTVLKTPVASSPEQLIRLFHQSQLEWARHFGDETELDFGRWIPADGCLLDAYLLPGFKPSDVLTDMIERSRQAGCEWNCCTLNPSMPKEQTVPLVNELLATGWVSRPIEILYRAKNPNSTVFSKINNLKIIPARASYRHYKQLMGDQAAIHLDDSHFESLLALADGQPIGCIGVLTSGEVGTIRDWHVIPERRHNGIGRLLLDRALESCVRGMLRHVMIGLPDSAVVASRVCTAFGFEMIGNQAWFNR